MTSQARIDANRLNAQLSTGPRTDEGKQASSRNATKHGFFQRLLPIETPAFQDMLTGLYYALRPANEIQQLLVDQIGIAYLRLARLYQHELQGGDSGVEMTLVASPSPECRDAQRASCAEPLQAPSSDEAQPSSLIPHPSSLLLRYETMLTRQIERNFKLLNEARELGWTLGRMLEKPPYFLPDFTGEDLAPDPQDPDDEAPNGAQTSPAAEDAPPNAFETGELTSTLEPDAYHAGTVERLCETQVEACNDDLQTASCDDDPSIDHNDDRATQHLAHSTQHQTVTPVPDHVVWLPGNLHQIDPITGVRRFRSERPAR